MNAPKSHFDAETLDAEKKTPYELIPVLEDIASQEKVKAITLACLRLLQHEDDEVRQWATECLSQSVQPTDADQAPLEELLDDLVGTCQTISEQDLMLADQLYWTLTILLRLDTLSNELVSRVQVIASWQTSQGARRWLHQSKQQALRVLTRFA